MLGRFLSNGFGLMVLAAFVYAVGDVLYNLLTSSLPITEIALVRFLLGGIILGPIILSRGVSLKGNQIKALVLRGVFGTVSFFCLLKSMTLIPFSLTMVLFYTYPIFVVFFSFLFLRETVGGKELVLIGIGFAGAYVLINPASHSLNPGHLFALLASCIGAMAMVMIRKARKTDGAMIIYFYFCLVGGAISSPFALTAWKTPAFPEWILLLALGFSLLVAQVMMNQGFKYCKAAEGSLLLMSELVFAGFAGISLFGDPVGFHFWAGASLVVASGLGLNWVHRRS